MKVARFLTIVTLTLIVLSSPSHALRLKMVITSYLTGSNGEGRGAGDGGEGGNPPPTVLDATLQRAFEVVYYLSFSGNLFIFLAAGHNFRRIFMQQMRAHILCVCLFFRFICCEDGVKGDHPSDPDNGSEEEAGDRSVQSSGSRPERLLRKQSLTHRYMTWLKVEDARRERGRDGFESIREISRGPSTSLEFCSGEMVVSPSFIEMEPLGLDLASAAATEGEAEGGEEGEQAEDNWQEREGKEEEEEDRKEEEVSVRDEREVSSEGYVNEGNINL